MRKILIAIFSLFFSLSLYAADISLDTTQITFPNLAPEPQHGEVGRLVSRLLMQNHYQKKRLDDSLSSAMYDLYLQKLDYGRYYFRRSDIEAFEKYRYSLDDFLRRGQVEPAFEIYNIYQQRAADRLEYAFDRLQQGFNYTIDEYIELHRENSPWPSDQEELDDLWRKRLKYAALNLKLAGKDAQGALETLRKRYKRIQKNISQYQSEDVFQLLMNALSECYDPHTNYLSPKNFDNFRIQMSQSLEGIGARLSSENDYTVVVEIVPGGPADKGKELHPKDYISGVAQGRDGEMVDVIGWRVDDVVQLIRGKKGTMVRLQVLHNDNPVTSLPDTVAIIREKVTLQDQTPKSDLLEIEHEGQKLRLGLIDIPAFYSDYQAIQRGERNYKSTSRDVRKLISELKQQNIDGLLIDLRRNGGGFLNEAIDLTGLFIDKGPVVQVRSTNGKIEIERDTDAGVAYDGPLAVMIDRLSASASEIFAAAIQDYHRGIIVGSQTFGKGTVQRPIDLNRFVRNSSTKLGQLKLTIAKFYRIDGGSTQHVGVIPDISLPSRYNLDEIGESTRDFALLWDQIEPVPYRDSGDIDRVIPRLETLHSARVSTDEEYANLLTDIKGDEKSRNAKMVSLHEETRRKERAKSGKKDSPHGSSDESKEAEEEKDKLKKDYVLKESAHILGDYIVLKSVSSKQ